MLVLNTETRRLNFELELLLIMAESTILLKAPRTLRKTLYSKLRSLITLHV